VLLIPCKYHSGGHRQAQRRDCEENPEILKHCKEMKKDNPQASTHSICSMKVERECLDKFASTAAQLAARLVLPMGDGGIVQSSRPLQTEKIIEEMKKKGIAVSVKPLPKTDEEFRIFAANYAVEKSLPQPDFGPAPPVDYESMVEARRCLNSKGPIDHDAVAKSVMHLLSLDFAKQEGDFKTAPPIEAWNDDKKRWDVGTGMALPKLRTAIKDALRNTFGGKDLSMKYVDEKLVPFRGRPNPLFGQQAFRNNVLLCVLDLLPFKARLDDEKATGHLIHFDCGTTLDLGPNTKFEEQVRPGRREDRGSKSTGKPFEAWQSDIKDSVKNLCDRLSKEWSNKDFTLDITHGSVLDALDDEKRARVAQAKQFREELDVLLPQSPLLKFLYASHNEWDPTLFELRQFARGASGCRLFDEFMVYLGKEGSNRKSTTLMLLCEAFGSANRQGARGYVCVQKAEYFTQKNSAAASAPDEGVAAMKCSRFVLVDEFPKQAVHFNEKIVKQWSDGKGAPLPFEKKFGARDEVRPSWLMLWFCNSLPNFGECDKAFSRRLTIMPMYTCFMDEEEFDSENKSHVLADTSIRDNIELLVPELLFWLRCLAPGLWLKKSAKVLRPRPAIVEEVTAHECNKIVTISEAARDGEKEARDKFLLKLVEAADSMPTPTKDINKAASAAGIREPTQVFKNVGIEARTFTPKKAMGGGKDFRAYVKDGKFLKMEP